MKRSSVVLCICAFALFLPAAPASAQSDTPRVEVSGHYSLLSFDNQTSSSTVARHGFGGTFTYNFSAVFSAEGEINYFPKDFVNAADPRVRLPAPRVQGLFGLKAGIRREKFGLFAKVRPGFTRFTAVSDCPNNDPASCGDARKSGFAIDFGGVAEAYPTRHTLLRFDIGDTYAQFPDTTVFFPPEPGSIGGFFSRPGFHSHSLQINVGAGFRF